MNTRDKEIQELIQRDLQSLQGLKGIRHWENKNGTAVCEVHYTASPRKDPAREGREWYESARNGMPKASWLKEYELGWFAKSGQLVYPGFNRGIHLIPPFAIPRDWKRIMAIDHGLRNPTAALWIAITPTEKIIVYREYYVTEKTVSEHAKAIKELEKGEKISTRLIDPSTQSRNALDKNSVMDEYKRNGIICVPASNSLEAGINRVNTALSGYVRLDKKRNNFPVVEPAKLFFFSSLFHTVEEITNYRWAEVSPATLEKSNPVEKPTKKNDHLMDCLRYCVLFIDKYCFKIFDY